VRFTPRDEEFRAEVSAWLNANLTGEFGPTLLACGELAMEVPGAWSMVARGAPHDPDEWQRLFLSSRAETIYGGSEEIQHDIIATRALGLRREQPPGRERR
jgi:Acyl-CoA dehydrogenase, C-terminal domain